jgi:hypothetical protein
MRALGILILVCAGCFAAENTVPSFISAGFDAYARNGPDAAWNAWKIDYGETQAEKKASFIENIRGAEKRYGKMVGFELVRSTEIGSSYKNVFVLWRFEKAPLFCVFVCYRAKDDWRILDFLFADKPNGYVPQSLLDAPTK